MTSFLEIKSKYKFKMIKMMVKHFNMKTKTTNLMTKTLIKATKTFNFNPKRITVTNLLETTLLKRISVKAKRKKINFPL